jgi:serine protease DegQ
MASINGILSTLSGELVAAVQKGGQSIVRIDDGTRLTASGSVWSADGFVVATSHGVETDEGLTIETRDGKSYEAVVVGRDPESDIALLKASTDELTPFEPSQESAQAGALALALGSPGQAGLQATFGMIGSVSHEGTVLHGDFTLYPGFSGGALVDTQGNLLALLNLSFGRGRGAALSQSFVSGVVESIKQHGTVQRGYLGIGTQPVEISAQLRERLELSQTIGLLIVSVEADSPADQAGLFVGDVIAALNGQDMDDPRGLRGVLGRQGAGATVNLKVVRGGQIAEVSAVLGGRESESQERAENGHGQSWRRGGRRRQR